MTRPVRSGRGAVAGALLVGASALTAAAASDGTAAEWIGCVVGWTGLWAVWAWQRPARRLVWIVALAARAVWLPVPVVLSDDAYRYVWDGMAVLDGVNPYATRPENRPLEEDDSWLRGRLNSPAYHSVYPPVSQAAFVPMAMAYRSAGGGEAGWQRASLALKGIFGAAELLALWLLSRRAGRRAFAAYALLPLVVIDGFAQPHTDTLLVLALVAAACGSPGAGRLALVGMAGWTKLWPWALAAARGVVRSRGLAPAATGVLLGMIGLPLMQPGAWRGLTGSLDLYVRWFEFYAGPYYALKSLGVALTGADPSKALGPALRNVFACVAAILLVASHGRRWPFQTTALALSAALLLTATTVHPWYLLAPIALLAMHDASRGPAWVRPAWAAAAVLALGASMTYAFYRGAPMGTLSLVGWGGALVCAGAVWALPGGLDALMRHRARGKLRCLSPEVPEVLDGLQVLDLGAGEGHVGAELARRGARVTLADVVDARRVPLPFVHLAEDAALPFGDDAFDLVILVYVLHHAAHPERLLNEALRVGRRVVVLESVYETPLERRVLTWLDRYANGLRGDWMHGQPLQFRRAIDWNDVYRSTPNIQTTMRERGHPPHRQAVLQYWKSTVIANPEPAFESRSSGDGRTAT